jgi:hypothetical protein
MALIGRLFGHAHRKKGDDGGDQVQPGVQRFGEHAKASRPENQKRLEGDKQNG